jgi:hypothetical protein
LGLVPHCILLERKLSPDVGLDSPGTGSGPTYSLSLWNQAGAGAGLLPKAVEPDLFQSQVNAFHISVDLIKKFTTHFHGRPISFF